MFPPFEQERAAGVILDILQKLGSSSITLLRDSKPSDERNNSLVMLGVLVCKKTDAKEGEFVNLITVSGISCSLKGEIPGIFVEPVVSNGQILKALEENDLEIHELTDKIKKEVLPQKQAELKKLREKLCDASLLKVFDKYSFCCADKKERKLLDIIDYQKTKKLPPTGTGDCCAPKLLNYAFKNSLVPLSMAETKIHFVLNGKTAQIEHTGKKTEFYPPCDSRCSLILPSILGLEILYRDSDIIVVNKQSGVLSVPGRGPEKQDCIVNRVKKLFPDCIEQPSVHRLDMETSGLLVLAFTKEAHRELNRQFEAREVHKKYIALIDGILAKKGIEKSGTMELFFRLDIENRPHQIWDRENGKSAVTQWQIENVEYYTAPDKSRRPATRVTFIPHTGRTHQLRLAAADSHGFGLPIIGDTLYGHCEKGERLLLHASELSFTHPRTKQKMDFLCPPEF
ncbi:RluA family pseudouridine synthase [uncultured Treponema sp.]|uniref:RluA family pseudouridine synthase n=1 Tax=uncultured Treponema sp. TaxID=162155 RepID=UPI002587382B|nr:RluA family pseudouridine synthase [uncultured Treponema sp.]